MPFLPRGMLIFLFISSPLWAKTAGEKVDLLERALRNVGETAEGDRQVDGAGLLMVGVASVTAALLANQSPNSSLRAEGPAVFGTLGSAFMLGGLLTLGLRREYETFPERYRQMPERTPQDLAAKAQAGEEFLLTLSERSRRERYWIAGGAGVAGTALFISYLASPPYLGGAFLYFSGFCFFIGVVNLASEGTSELEQRSYLGAEANTVSWGVSPVPGGAQATFAWRF